jgi:hypothetical protein
MAKAFNAPADETWIDWAIEMIEAGFESPNLYMLAGETAPFNQFKLHDLTKNVLEDLGLDYADKDAVLQNYTYHLISSSVDNPKTYLKTLNELKNICESLDLDGS